ncbi:unnamed protein product [Dibothriocephalus latus]|uniref:Cytosolic fatty-acid binding proteins domain-containing protein n=1 Tax=Dibothriocephalus latus TaxID=60516 RepID=A0A3P6PTR6_DIBLA|nr:unnamed protein product [Dibothriocephalus latus]
MDAFVGSWKLENSVGYEDYLARIGVGLITRKALNGVKPTLTISLLGEKYVMKEESKIKSTVTVFEMGVPFDELTPAGQPVKSVITLEGLEMKQVQTGPLKKIEITRVVDGANLKTVIRVDEITCQRTYMRLM